MASVAAGTRGVATAADASVATPATRLSLEHRMLLTATLCLLAGGAVMVYSASAPSTLSLGGSGMGVLIRFAAYALVGLVVLRFAARIGLEWVRRLTGPLLGVAFVLLVAVRLPGIGHASGTIAQRWLGVGPLQFEPSELMKLALVLYAAHIFSYGPPGPRSVAIAFKRLVIVGGCACLLIVTQPDIGTAMVIAFALLAVVLVAGVPVRWLAIAGIGCALAVGGFALVNPYAAARLTSFVDPWAHAQTSGFQSVQSQIAVGSGGLLGRGPGASVQKDFWLPEAPTDFILAVIGEELGFVGIAVLLFLYGLIAFAGMRAARRARDAYATLIAVGVTALITFQASLNVFAVLGIAPVTGVPLPFVSYGASNLLVILAGMGLLLNVAGGGSAGIRAVRSTGGRKSAGSGRGRTNADRDRGGRHRRARGAGAGGGGRPADAGG
jgi:cell division protein FtsW